MIGFYENTSIKQALVSDFVNAAAQVECAFHKVDVDRVNAPSTFLSVFFRIVGNNITFLLT